MSSSEEEEEDVPLAVPLEAPAPAKVLGVSAFDQPRAQQAEAPAPVPAVAPVPITLITGYLGAGKTTLVNHVLTAKHGYRCAVLLNEIADSADIERALVKEPEGREASPLTEWTELENGCICCSAKNDMVKALETLMQQRARFDYVLIETTGLANPGPVAASLWTDEQLESSVCLDCIVTVVDARNVERQLADPRPNKAINEAQQQVAFADIVLLNKADLACEEQLQRIEGTMRSMNAEAAIVRCRRCKIDLARILNTGIYSAGMRGVEAAAAADSAELQGLEAAAGGAEHAADEAEQQQCGDTQCNNPEQRHHHHHGNSSGGQHDSRVGTVTIRLPGRALDLSRLRHWLDALLWEQGSDATAAAAQTAPEIFRIKGLLHVAGSGRRHILQGVHEIYDVVEGPVWAPGEPRGSKLVFIGRKLHREALQNGLDACLDPV